MAPKGLVVEAVKSSQTAVRFRSSPAPPAIGIVPVRFERFGIARALRREVAVDHGEGDGGDAEGEVDDRLPEHRLGGVVGGVDEGLQEVDRGAIASFTLRTLALTWESHSG